jgi:hypothetical protein
MSPDRLRVTLERTGGLVGRTIRRGLDTTELPEGQAAELRALVSSLPADGERPAGPGGPPGAGATGRGSSGPDRFAYRLQIERAAGRLVRTFSEPVPDELRPLLSMLSKAPLLPRRH